MSSSAPLRPGLIVAGRYRIEQQIGEGGMGAVYLVRHVRTDEMLALKVLHADVLKDATAVERFRREARAPAKIASEHIARVTDADTAADLDNAPFYVMEYLRGRDLDRILAEEGPLSPAQVVEYLRQTARALDKAHQLGIIHRDLKPENLFLTQREDGTACIKLLDFGIARLGDTGAVNPLKTQAGYIFGTPAFMSPEQALGDIALIGPATDVWALGLVAFKLLMARDFWGEHPTARLCAMILTGPIPTPSERGSTFGAGFDAWFAKCVARPVDERFRTAGEAVARLADSLGIHLSEQMRASGRPSAPPMSEAITGHLMTPQSFAPTQIAHDQTGSAQIPLPIPKRSSAGVIFAMLGTGLFLAVGAIALVYATHGKSAASAELTSTKPVAVADAGVDISALAPIDSTSDSTALIASADAPHADTHPKASASHSADAPLTSATSRPIAAPPPRTDQATLTRDQKHRLESLQRLCDQGTFTPSECQAKRVEIAHSP
ncbi:MAG: serine/threonine-protein kinase [Polyangiaceae bacterium]